MDKEKMDKIDKLSLEKGYDIELDMSKVGVLSMVLDKVIEKLNNNDFENTISIKFIKLNK